MGGCALSASDPGSQWCGVRTCPCAPIPSWLQRLRRIIGRGGISISRETDKLKLAIVEVCSCVRLEQRHIGRPPSLQTRKGACAYNLSLCFYVCVGGGVGLA